MVGAEDEFLICQTKYSIRYVDDINLVLKAIDGDENQNKGERTITKLHQIANSIHPSIRVTVDFPSNHQNGRMLILDTEQWIDNVEVGDFIKRQICHSH